MMENVKDKIYSYCPLLKEKCILENLQRYLGSAVLCNVLEKSDSLDLDFCDTLGNKISVVLQENSILMLKRTDKFAQRISVTSNLEINEYFLEKRKNGVIVSKIAKKYAPYLDRGNTLVSLKDENYVFDKEMVENLFNGLNFDIALPILLLPKFRILELYEDLRSSSKMDCVFSAQLNVTKNNKERRCVYYNDLDLSSLYDVIDEKNTLERIYDLYLGKIQKENIYDFEAIKEGLLSKDVFDIRGAKEYTKNMESLIGIEKVQNDSYLLTYLEKNYGVKLDGYNRDKVFALIMPDAISVVKKHIEKVVGMPYDKFMALDIDEQHKIIENATGKKFKYDTRLFIDGICFDKDHILTREETEKKLEKIMFSGPQRVLKKIFDHFRNS